MGYLVKTKFEGFSLDGRRMYPKSSGGGQENYKNLDKLYGEQADSARLLRLLAEENLPGAVGSYVRSSQEFLDPKYVQNQVGNAMADMVSANAMERAATDRNLASMGVNPNDPRFAGTLRSVDTSNAARMAAGTNAVRDQAKVMQNSVAKDMVGTFTGQSNMAAQQTASAAGGMANLAAQQQQALLNKQAQQANAMGAAVGGGLAAYNTFFKDGGKVKPVTLALANGGFLSPATPMPPPTASAPPRTSPLASGLQMYSLANTGRNAPNRLGLASDNKFAKLLSKADLGTGMDFQTSQAARGMTPSQQSAAAQQYRDAAAQTTDPGMRSQYLRTADGLDPTGQTAAPVQDATVKSAAQITDPNASLLQPGNYPAPEVFPVDMSGTTVTSAEPTMALLQGGEPAAALASAAPAADAAALASMEFGTAGTALGSAGTAAGTGATVGTTAGAMGGAMSAIGAALPWVGAALAIGSMFELFKDGGKVAKRTRDYRDGDKVPGKWKGNTDKVPAMLTEEEGVINAEGMALLGDAALENINAKGLALRKAGRTPDDIPAIGLGALA